MYPLNIVDIDGTERFSWGQKDPQRRVQRCWTEHDWLGEPHTTCDWFWEPDPPTYSIVNTDTLGRLLPDYDVIQVRLSAAPPGQVQIVLSVDSMVTWWKALRVISNLPSFAIEHELYGSGSYVPNAPDDRQQTEPIILEIDNLRQSEQQYPGRGSILLGKAKFMGWHEWMYGIRLSDLLRFDGKRVQFHWRA